MADYEIGSLITFRYPIPPPPRPLGTSAHDPNPHVLVLHPRWDRWPRNNPPGNYLLHGLAFKKLTDQEKNMVRMILNPKFEEEYGELLKAENPALMQQFDRIMHTAASAVITSPHDFYTRVIAPFISVRPDTPYRLWNLRKMQNVRILQSRRYLSGELDGEKPFGRYATQFQNFLPGNRPLPRPASRFETRLPSKTPTFGGPHRPGALPGTEE